MARQLQEKLLLSLNLSRSYLNRPRPHPGGIYP